MYVLNTNWLSWTLVYWKFWGLNKETTKPRVRWCSSLIWVQVLASLCIYALSMARSYNLYGVRATTPLTAEAGGFHVETNPGQMQWWLKLMIEKSEMLPWHWLKGWGFESCNRQSFFSKSLLKCFHVSSFIVKYYICEPQYRFERELIRLCPTFLIHSEFNCSIVQYTYFGSRVL